jgi:hypothetical protein
MGPFDNIRRKIPGSPRNIAKHLLKYYLADTTKFPDLTTKEIFRKMLQDRYAVFKTMNTDDINRVVSGTDTLVELTLAVIAYENPAAMSSHYQKETSDDIFNFFKENAPREFEKFVNKANSAEKKESTGKETKLMMSRCIDTVRFLEKHISENVNIQINTSEIYIFGMFLISQAYIMAKGETSKTASQLDAFFAEIAMYIADKCFPKKPSINSEDFLEWHDRFSDHLMSKGIAYGKAFDNDVENQRTALSETLSAFFKNLFIDPISTDLKNLLMVSLASKLPALLQRLIKKFK